MSAWIEMENLSRDIADANSRMEAAKTAGSDDLAQLVHKEVAQLEARRAKLLASIATSLVDGEAEVVHEERTAGPPEGTNDPLIAAEPQEKEVSDIVRQREAVMEAIHANQDDQNGCDAAKEVITPFQDPKSGRSAPRDSAESWAQITPADLNRAKADLNNRWVETLARHAAELKVLAADESDIDNVERAIEVFTRKFLSNGKLVPLAAQSG